MRSDSTGEVSSQARPRGLTALSATQIAESVSKGELSAAEVVEAFIHRIEEVDGRLNAVVTRRFGQARADARELDAARARGEPLGPLAGVPMTVKDPFDVAGLPTTFGLPTRGNHVAREDGPLVKRLRGAGAVILGKTNVSELLFFQEGDNPLFGRTNNPWNLERTSGGGSGGEGAIIAARGSALGLASDVGGSIRTPAHFNGIHGFRPTSRRLTIVGSPPELFFPGFEAIALDPGTLARHVADLSRAMAVLAAPGQERLDVRVPPVPWREPAEVDVSGLRIAMFDDDGYWPASPALRRAVHEAAAALRGRGAQVETFSPPGPGTAPRLYNAFLSADALEWTKPVLHGNPVDSRIRIMTQGMLLPRVLRAPLGRLLTVAGQRRLAAGVTTARGRSAGEYWALVAERDAWRGAFLAAMDAGGFDAILCPAHTLPALRHGASRDLYDTTSYLVTYNVLGMPAGVVAATRVRAGEESDRPSSLDIIECAARRTEEGSAGLPVGVQVAARHWRDDVVLAVMAALEEHFRRQPDYPGEPPL
ncbi:amidase [Pyxidicoccus parkwayensis]|uniref:Amidase n=1 Tax=Pyxidicoccus parkwayensis TaxID=2813578 RepID=A0ABX7NN08_9BACT|nr:amidase family protein [Pyxidicoccus parkwaysis]QSQ20043.1 amidase [Pyxidicoccus parkwaysis]